MFTRNMRLSVASCHADNVLPSGSAVNGIPVGQFCRLSLSRINGQQVERQIGGSQFGIKKNWSRWQPHQVCHAATSRHVIIGRVMFVVRIMA